MPEMAPMLRERPLPPLVGVPITVTVGEPGGSWRSVSTAVVGTGGVVLACAVGLKVGTDVAGATVGCCDAGALLVGGSVVGTIVGSLEGETDPVGGAEIVGPGVMVGAEVGGAVTVGSGEREGIEDGECFGGMEVTGTLGSRD
jgi:hypothetical protein